MNKKYSKNPEEYAAFVWGENKVCFPGYEYVIHFAEPRCMIKYQLSEAFTDFDSFFDGIAEIQWFDGKQFALQGRELKEFLTRVWNYLAIEERILEDDLDEMEDEDF